MGASFRGVKSSFIAGLAIMGSSFLVVGLAFGFEADFACAWDDVFEPLSKNACSSGVSASSRERRLATGHLLHELLHLVRCEK